MKKTLFLLLIVIASGTAVMAQAPQKFSYQAVVRNSSDELVKNTGIGMQISILQGSPTGSSVYVERQFPTTSPAGLVAIEIGSGIVVSGSFSGINWSSGAYYIKSEIDLNGGASYTMSGTSQALSVPYALYAKTANESDPVWTAAAGSYYTKTNVQTAGQAAIDAANITTGAVALANGGTGAVTAAAARANLGLGALATLNAVTSTQISDGTITGVDIAPETITGAYIMNGTINSVDILDGTITSADIGNDVLTAIDIAADAITASEIAAGAVGSSEIIDGTIVTADVSSIDAGKISGITSGYIPKSDGTGLIDGQIKDNGNNVYIGSSYNSASKFFVYGTATQPTAINCQSIISSNSNNVGLQTSAGYAQNGNTGLITEGFALNQDVPTTNYGIKTNAYGGGGTNYGIYCSASGFYAINWAAYFEAGNVHITNQIESPNLTSSSGTALVLDASGWIRKNSSDFRLKENITPLQNTLNRVLKLQGVNFTWKSDGTHSPDVGFIAQDVQKIFPELVVEDRNDGMLSVKYMNMAAVLTEAIKEQQLQIEQLKKEIESLRKQLGGSE